MSLHLTEEDDEVEYWREV